MNQRVLAEGIGFNYRSLGKFEAADGHPRPGMVLAPCQAPGAPQWAMARNRLEKAVES